MSTYQAHARRREKAAAKAAMSAVEPREFGECSLCGFMHNRPLERTVCPVCERELCLGEPVCGCEEGADGVRGGEYNAADAVGAARATAGPHSEYRPPTWRYPHGE